MQRNSDPAGGRAPLYVISRDGEPERLVAMWAEAERLGVALHRIAATDVAPGDDAELMRVSDHRRAWTRIAGSDAPHAVVLEDGAALDDRLGALLDADRLAREVPGHGLVNLDGGRPGEGEPRIVAPATPPARCGAYVIGREAAGALLAATRRTESLERTLARRGEHGVEMRVAEPAPVVAAGVERSTNGWLSRLGDFLRRGVTERVAAPAVPPLRPAPIRD